MRIKVSLLLSVLPTLLAAISGANDLVAQVTVAVPVPLTNIERVSPWKDYRAPIWSPDGAHIAYTQQGYSSLLVVDVHSYEERLLVEGPACGYRPEWAENGEGLYFRSNRGIFTAPLERMVTLDGVRSEAFKARREELAGFKVVQDAILFSRNGKGIAKSIINIDDKFYGPVLSPDQRYLAFQGISTGIYILEIESGRTISIGQGDYPTWAPSSNAILFDRTEDDGHFMTEGDIYCYRLDDQMLVQLTVTPGIVEQRANVSPDGKKVAYDALGSIFIGELAEEVLK